MIVYVERYSYLADDPYDYGEYEEEQAIEEWGFPTMKSDDGYMWTYFEEG
jgi:hypothetical protein